MINLINKYLEIEKKLDEEHNVLHVSETNGVPKATLHGFKNFLEIVGDNKIKVSDWDGDLYKYEAHSVVEGIEFSIIFNSETYEKIMKVEGVVHE